MKIQQSEIAFLSSHQKEQEIYESESLQMWNTDEDAPEEFRQGDRLELTENFQKLYNGGTSVKVEDEMFDTSLSPELMEIVRALEALLGRKINIPSMHNLQKSESLDVKQQAEEPQTQRLGWGIDYNYERTKIHKEQLEFSVQGSVQTADGKKIDFSLGFSMKRSSQTHQSISFKAGDALIDPLVLNFGTSVVAMSEVKHSFDLDLDGKSEEFSFVGSGSGFLALDKNGDGIINDGSELFGPTLGNGFNELRAYDSDKNNWIDENDAVFDQLVIWTKDEEGNENLFSLKDKGVGALYLQSAVTPFELTTNDGELQGVMRESSIYLKEEGGAGTLQELDLVV